MKEIYAALVKAQGQIKIALKDSKNPHFKSTYADLGSVWDAVRDALQSNGLAVIQLTRIHESGTPVLLTRIIHVSGQHIEGEYPIVCKDPNDPQKVLSSVTYSRRASLAAAMGVIADDDDGNSAAGHTPMAKPATPPPPQVAAKPSVSQVFTQAGLQYPQALEELIGKAMKSWTDADKVLARQAVESLNKGKSWAEITRSHVFQ